MKGKWSGKYTYDNPRLQRKLGCNSTFFEISIDYFDGKRFTGTICDDQETGGIPGTGRIRGKISGDQIRFVKLMPVLTCIQRDGTIQHYENKKHFPVHYSGKFDLKTRTITGSWKVGPGIRFLGFTALMPQKTTGKWEMHANMLT
jgi:hypothetical protein